MRLDYHTLSFFPLFGILVIHLPYVNGKHERIITKFAVTKLKACKIEIIQSGSQMYFDWLIFSMAFG